MWNPKGHGWRLGKESVQKSLNARLVLDKETEFASATVSEVVFRQRISRTPDGRLCHADKVLYGSAMQGMFEARR